jgi:WD40 repeat protein
VWDAETGTVLQTLESHDSVYRLVTFTQDAKACLAVVNRDNGVRLWDIEAGTKLSKVLRGHPGGMGAMLTFEAVDGSPRLVVGSERTITVWDVEEGKVIHKMKAHETAIITQLQVIVSEEDGRYRLISGDMYGGVRVWDLGEAPPARRGNIRAANKTG